MGSDIALLERIDDILQIGTMTFLRTPLGNYVPTYVSEQALRLLGYGKDEFMEKFANDISPIFAEEEQDRIALALTEFLNQGRVLSLVVRLQKKDGTIFTSTMRFSFLEKDTFCIGFTPFTQEDQLWLDVMEDTSVGIHLINADTYQLYYSNPAGFTLSGTEPHPYHHMHCYEALFNRKTPCGFCNCEEQKEGSHFSEKSSRTGKSSPPPQAYSTGKANAS